MTRRELFKSSWARLSALMQQYPGDGALRQAELQLEYLIDLETGNRTDRRRLHEINIGLLTVREIEMLDDDVAELLHQVSAEVELMKNEVKRKDS